MGVRIVSSGVDDRGSGSQSIALGRLGAICNTELSCVVSSPDDDEHSSDDHAETCGSVERMGAVLILPSNHGSSYENAVDPALTAGLSPADEQGADCHDDET